MTAKAYRKPSTQGPGPTGDFDPQLVREKMRDVDEQELIQLRAYRKVARYYHMNTTALIFFLCRDKYKGTTLVDHLGGRYGDR